MGIEETIAIQGKIETAIECGYFPLIIHEIELFNQSLEKNKHQTTKENYECLKYNYYTYERMARVYNSFNTGRN